MGRSATSASSASMATWWRTHFPATAEFQRSRERRWPQRRLRRSHPVVLSSWIGTCRQHGVSIGRGRGRRRHPARPMSARRAGAGAGGHGVARRSSGGRFGDRRERCLVRCNDPVAILDHLATGFRAEQPLDPPCVSSARRNAPRRFVCATTAFLWCARSRFRPPPQTGSSEEAADAWLDAAQRPSSRASRACLQIREHEDAEGRPGGPAASAAEAQTGQIGRWLHAPPCRRAASCVSRELRVESGGRSGLVGAVADKAPRRSRAAAGGARVRRMMIGMSMTHAASHARGDLHTALPLPRRDVGMMKRPRNPGAGTSSMPPGRHGVGRATTAAGCPAVAAWA